MKKEIQVYGIKNCSSVKKALFFLDDKELKYDFFDYKKQEASTELLNEFCENLDWQKVLNKRSQTWRKLDDEQKKDLTLDKAIKIMRENTSIIKRPLVKISTSEKYIYLLGLEDIFAFFNLNKY